MTSVLAALKTPAPLYRNLSLRTAPLNPLSHHSQYNLNLISKRVVDMAFLVCRPKKNTAINLVI